MRSAGRKNCSTQAYSEPRMRSSSSSSTASFDELADEEHRVLVADGERGAVELQVAAQQVLVELLVVLLRRRHHVGLVVQRALARA